MTDRTMPRTTPPQSLTASAAARPEQIAAATRSWQQVRALRGAKYQAALSRHLDRFPTRIMRAS